MGLSLLPKGLCVSGLGIGAEGNAALATTTFEGTLLGGAATKIFPGRELLPSLAEAAGVFSPARISGRPEASGRPVGPAANSPRRLPSGTFIGPLGITG